MNEPNDLTDAGRELVKETLLATQTADCLTDSDARVVKLMFEVRRLRKQRTVLAIVLILLLLAFAAMGCAAPLAKAPVPPLPPASLLAPAAQSAPPTPDGVDTNLFEPEDLPGAPEPLTNVVTLNWADKAFYSDAQGNDLTNVVYGIVQSSQDLTNWADLQPFVALTGPTNWSETNTLGTNFYRLVILPAVTPVITATNISP